MGGEDVARIGAQRGKYMALVGRHDGKISLRIPRSRWEDNIKSDIEEVRWGVVNWIGLAQDRDSWRAIVNVVIKLRVP